MQFWVRIPPGPSDDKYKYRPTDPENGSAGRYLSAYLVFGFFYEALHQV